MEVATELTSYLSIVLCFSSIFLKMTFSASKKAGNNYQNISWEQLSAPVFSRIQLEYSSNTAQKYYL